MCCGTGKHYRKSVLDEEYLLVQVIYHRADGVVVGLGLCDRSLIAHADISAKEFIDRSVINEIKHALRTTGHSISDIADLFDFPSVGNLSRYFKSRTGITLSEYRQSVR